MSTKKTFVSSATRNTASRKATKSLSFHRSPVADAKLKWFAALKGSPSRRAFLLQPSYSMNKDFATDLQHLHRPLTIAVGYYSRDYARWAESSISRFHQSGGDPKGNAVLIFAVRSCRAPHPRGGREVPAASRTDF